MYRGYVWSIFNWLVSLNRKTFSFTLKFEKAVSQLNSLIPGLISSISVFNSAKFPFHKEKDIAFEVELVVYYLMIEVRV